jgi:hypothetical protein
MRHSAPAVASGVLCALVLFAWSSPLPAADAGVIGSVKNVSGGAVVVRAEQRLPAAAGLKLRSGDVLETGPDARLGVILRDDSLVSMGPSSRLAIDRFVFSPAEGRFDLVIRALRGTMAYVSGLIVKLAPESASIVTPVTTIGVRGTRLALRVAD